MLERHDQFNKLVGKFLDDVLGGAEIGDEATGLEHAR
jgi:hypothetical protein